MYFRTKLCIPCMVGKLLGFISAILSRLILDFVGVFANITDIWSTDSGSVMSAWPNCASSAGNVL